MGRIWEDPPKRRSPMDSGNNETAIGRLIRKLLEPKPKPKKGKHSK